MFNEYLVDALAVVPLLFVALTVVFRKRLQTWFFSVFVVSLLIVLYEAFILLS